MLCPNLPETRNPKLETQNPRPETRNPKSKTLNPKARLREVLVLVLRRMHGVTVIKACVVKRKRGSLPPSVDVKCTCNVHTRLGQLKTAREVKLGKK
jgi:hypothetical protein